MIYVYGMKPVRFHWYPSVVMNPIFKMEYSDSYEIKEFERSLINEFRNAGIKTIHGGEITTDNKIVFECEVDGKIIFYGFKDWFFSIGFGVMTY